MSVRSGSPWTSTSTPSFSCSLMEYWMYSLISFSYFSAERVPFLNCRRALLISAHGISRQCRMCALDVFETAVHEEIKKQIAAR